MRYRYIIFLVFSITIFISCDDEYEKAVIGTYEVNRYKTINEVQDEGIDNLKVIICQNKKIKISTDKAITFGEWDVYDDGDRTVIKFMINNKIAEGVVLGEGQQVGIRIYNGEKLFYENLAEIYLEKQKSP
ncbi:hypothetical protein [Flavobacterium sp. LC2016-01]|uniref:hypothetical protein n=1 Tax=Flavobacterium sp. LC2016-01 TaxID=2675876 RepID=UPI0012BA8469|nr:hypothetical protein [Flavobacterium sp. LC2016-01]MTH14931.1 hypothetical protein [Flavobacterium sp. LC2016-01]